VILPVFNIGQKVRILQNPYWGEIGTLTALPPGQYATHAGLWSPGAEVQTPDGQKIFVPFANLENLG